MATDYTVAIVQNAHTNNSILPGALDAISVHWKVAQGCGIRDVSSGDYAISFSQHAWGQWRNYDVTL